MVVDFQDHIQVINNKKPATDIPVFSVINCTNRRAVISESFGFSTSVMDSEKKHGNFDLSAGVFNVQTEDTYLLNLTPMLGYLQAAATIVSI